MAGFYGVLLKENSEKNIYKYFFNHQFHNINQEEINFDNFIFGRSVINKFNNDRFIFENENYIICFEGINYGNIKKPQDFINHYEKTGDRFISLLRGNFSGFLFSKKENKAIVFNDQLATKDIYYYYDRKTGFAFASEMHVLSKLLRNNNIKITQNEDAIYSMALYGQMFDEFTYAKEIKRMPYGSVISFNLDSRQIKVNKYFNFKKEIKETHLNEVVENIDSFICNSIREEWQKDKDEGYSQHFALISGGMDSRVNCMLAKKLGFNNINTYTYGNPNSSDVKIANKISKENFYSHLQYNLYNGDFLIKNILNDYVKSTDGLTHFTANAIIYNAMRRVNVKNYGLVHSGQLGDTVSGSFLKPNFNFKLNKDKIGLTGFVKNPNLLTKLSFLDELTNRYNLTDYELFAYEQRQVNGTLIGDRVFNNFIDQVSPFYNIELLEYTLSLPIKFKINQRLYFEWLKKKHPEILEYKWEKIGLKPNNTFNIKYGYLGRKYFNGAKKYFNLKYDNMNPIGTWFKENPSLLKEYDLVFKENIHLLNNKEIEQDLSDIYDDSIFAFRNKFAALTAVLAIKLHFYS